MSALERQVVKQLLCLEDVNLGVGTELQSRNGTNYTVTKFIPQIEIPLYSDLQTVNYLKITRVSVRDKLIEGDGGGADFYWDPISVESDNGVTIIKITTVTTGRWKRLFRGPIATSKDLRLVESTSIAAHTGTVTEDTLYTSISIPNWAIVNGGHKGVLDLSGICTLTGTADITLYLSDGTTPTLIGTVTLPIGATKFKLESNLRYVLINSQVCSTTSITNLPDTDLDVVPTSLDLTGLPHTLILKVQLTNSGDNIEFKSVELTGSYGSQ